MIRIPNFQYNYNNNYNTKITNVFPTYNNHTPSFKANSLNKKTGIIPFFMGLISGLKGLVNPGTENAKTNEKSSFTQEGTNDMGLTSGLGSLVDSGAENTKSKLSQDETNSQIRISEYDKSNDAVHKASVHEYHLPHDFLSNPTVKEIQKQDPAFFDQYCENFIYNAEDDRDIDLQIFNGIYRIKQENPLAYNFLVSDYICNGNTYAIITDFVDYNLKDNYTEESEKSVQRIKELAKELKLKEDGIEIPLIFAHQKEPEKVEKVMRYLKTTDYNSIALIVGNKGAYVMLIEDDPTAF